MIPRGRLVALAVVLLLAVLIPDAHGQIKAFVGIAPEACLVERIGGSHVSVSVLVGPGQNHHTFEPTPKQMVDLAEATVYFSIGLPFERRLLEKIREANPSLKCIDAREGISLRKMETADEGAESEQDHGAGAMDPHVWLSPLNAKIIAANICKGLEEVDPVHAADYENNLDGLQKELEALNARIAGILAPFKGQAFYVYHPAFGYFADAYGLKQVPIEIEGKEPTPKQLAELIARAKADGVRVIFVQQQFPRRPAEAIAEEIGCAVVSIDPLLHDYIRNLERIAEELRAALQTK
jgi:zinc transport system substrate-binding protein